MFLTIFSRNTAWSVSTRQHNKYHTTPHQIKSAGHSFIRIFPFSNKQSILISSTMTFPTFNGKYFESPYSLELSGKKRENYWEQMWWMHLHPHGHILLLFWSLIYHNAILNYSHAAVSSIFTCTISNLFKCSGWHTQHEIVKRSSVSTKHKQNQLWFSIDFTLCSSILSRLIPKVNEIHFNCHTKFQWQKHHILIIVIWTCVINLDNTTDDVHILIDLTSNHLNY